MDISMNEYTEGDTAVCRGEFKDANGAYQDPTTVKFVFEPPGAAAVEYTYLTDSQIVRVSAGIYTVDLDTTDKPGTWYYRFYSTGTGKAAEQNQFHVITARP